MKKTRLKIALIIPAGVSITVANDAIELLSVVTDKTINDLSKWSKEIKSLLLSSLSLISAKKYL